MANEILYSGNGADLRMAETMEGLWLLLQNIQSVRLLLTNLGDAAGSGSSTHNVGQVNLSDAMAATTEGNSVSNTALTDAAVPVAIARQSLKRSSSYLMELTGSAGQFSLTNPGIIAMDGAAGATLRLAGMVAGLFGSVANSVGTTGVDASIDDWYDGVAQLESVGVNTEIAAIIHPQQMKDLRTSLRGESNGGVFQPASSEVLAVSAPGYKGRLAGVDIYTNSQVALDGGSANRVGCMFGSGAFGFREGSAANLARVPGMDIVLASLPDGSPIFSQFNVNKDSGQIELIHNYFVGVAEVEDLRACGFVTDA